MWYLFFRFDIDSSFSVGSAYRSAVGNAAASESRCASDINMSRGEECRLYGGRTINEKNSTLTLFGICDQVNAIFAESHIEGE